MKKIILLFAIVILFLINTHPISACSCATIASPTESLKTSTAIFVGKVINIDIPTGDIISSSDRVTVTFQVSQSWKGSTDQTIVLTTARYGSLCGVGFKDNEEYIVYASGEEDALTAHLCSGTKLLAYAQDDLKELNWKNDSTCTDSDGGINYYVKGSTTEVLNNNGEISPSESTIMDYCSTERPEILVEQYCKEIGFATKINWLCPNGCSDGACVGETEKPCTAEAKICPDGTSVAREGPNCEFRACPTTTDNCTKYSICPDGRQVKKCWPSGDVCVCYDSLQEACKTDQETECQETYTCPDGSQVKNCVRIGDGCACPLYPEKECGDYTKDICCKVSYTSEDTIKYVFSPKESCISPTGSEKVLEIVEESACIVQRENKLGINSPEACPSGCECTASVIECLLEDGTRTITITAGESGNIIIQIRGVEVRTSVVLYHHNGKIYGNFKGEPKELKVLPDEAKQKVEDEIETKIEEEEIELDEEGEYNIKAKKKSRLFFVFPVSEKVQTTVSSETGIVGKVNTPWWGFLAKNV